MDKGHYQDAPKLLRNDDLFCTGQHPVDVQGQLLLPASQLHSGIVTRDDNGKLVQLHMLCATMLGNELGMFVRMTPQGARHLAQDLMANAATVEAHVAEQAAILIEAARKGGAR
jgi:hypothetical protein